MSKVSSLSRVLSRATVPARPATVDTDRVAVLAGLPASSKERAASKALPADVTQPTTTAIIHVPTLDEAHAIVDGAANATAWADAKAQIHKIIDNACGVALFADTDTLSAYLSAGLGPVLVSTCPGSDWHKRTTRAYGIKVASERADKAKSAIKQTIRRRLEKNMERLFSLVAWEHGMVVVMDVLGAPAELPTHLRAMGFQPAAYSNAYLSALTRFTDAVAKTGADKGTAGSAEAAAPLASLAPDEAGASDTSDTPAAAPAPSFRDAMAIVLAGLKDGSADTVSTPDMVKLSSALAGYMTQRAESDKQAKGKARKTS